MPSKIKDYAKKRPKTSGRGRSPGNDAGTGYLKRYRTAPGRTSVTEFQMPGYHTKPGSTKRAVEPKKKK